MGGKPQKPKRACLEHIVQPPLREGDVWYLIPRDWWTQYLATGHANAMAPIDTRALVDSRYGVCAVSPHVLEHRDFEFVHVSIWTVLIAKFSAPVAIGRRVVSCNRVLKVDVYPVILRTCIADMKTGMPDWEVSRIREFPAQTTVLQAVNIIHPKCMVSYRVWVRHNSMLREQARASVEGWNDYILINDMSKPLADFRFEPGSYMFVELEQPDKSWARSWLYCGAHIDCLDLTARWYPATIIDVREDSVYVHYDHWASSWDEWIQKSSPKLAPRGTHIVNDFGLIEAASSGQLAAVKWIIQDLQVSPNVLLPSGCGALVAAVHEGHPQVVQFLLMRGADPEVNEAQSRRGDERFAGKKEWPSLFIGIERHQLAIVEQLIRYKASVNRVLEDISPLLLACQCGALEIAKRLVEYGSNVQFSTPSWTAMTIATAHEQLAIMQWLVGEHNAQLNEVHRGRLLLDSAMDKPSSLQWLVAKGADVSRCSQTILREEIRRAKGNTLEMLLAAGLLIPFAQYEIYERNVLTDAVNRIYARQLGEGRLGKHLAPIVFQYVVCNWEEASRFLIENVRSLDGANL